MNRGTRLIRGNEPHERNAALLSVLNLLTELRRIRRHLAGNTAGTQRIRNIIRSRPALIIRQSHEYSRRHLTARLRKTLRQNTSHHTSHTNRQANTRVRLLTVRSQRLITATRANRTQRLVTNQNSLIHGAGVVVQAASNRQVSQHLTRRTARRLLNDLSQLSKTLIQQLMLHRILSGKRTHLLHKRSILSADLRQLQGGSGSIRARTSLSLQLLSHTLSTNLLQLVNRTQNSRSISQTQAQVETLSQLAVIHTQLELRNRQLRQRINNNQRQGHVVTERQLAVANHVNISLSELAGTTLLRTLTTPHLLNLVTREREIQVAGVLHHVTGKRHGQVKVQSQLFLSLRSLVLLQARNCVNFLVNLTLAQQLLNSLYRTSLNRGETMQLKSLTQSVQNMILNQPLSRKILGKTRQRSLASHTRYSLTKNSTTKPRNTSGHIYPSYQHPPQHSTHSPSTPRANPRKPAAGRFAHNTTRPDTTHTHPTEAMLRRCTRTPKRVPTTGNSAKAPHPQHPRVKEL